MTYTGSIPFLWYSGIGTERQSFLPVDVIFTAGFGCAFLGKSVFVISSKGMNLVRERGQRDLEIHEVETGPVVFTISTARDTFGLGLKHKLNLTRASTPSLPRKVSSSACRWAAAEPSRVWQQAETLHLRTRRLEGRQSCKSADERWRGRPPIPPVVFLNNC